MSARIFDQPELRTEGNARATPAIPLPAPTRRLIPSWNLSLPPGRSVRIDLRVAATDADRWSAWLTVGECGDLPSPPPPIDIDDPAFGRVHIDEFRATRPIDRVQLRLVEPDDACADVPARVNRLALTWDDEPDAHARATPSSTAVSAPTDDADAARTPIELPVPFRSQYADTADLGPRLCSPTSLAMVLEYLGVARPTLDVARACYDPRHDLYGNWSRAVQTAAALGVPGYLARFSRWSHVRALLDRRLPVIASIRFEPGGLPGAPLPRTDGHLLVVRGFDARGGVWVNDPAHRDPAPRAYPLEALARAWFAGSAIGYILGA